MKRVLPVGMTFVAGLFTGFQLYAVLYLLPYLLTQLDEGAILDLVVFVSFIVLVFSQVEIGRRLAQAPAAVSLRDTLVAQSISFLVFVMSPQSFWLVCSFIAWLTAFSATQIALGRWTLLAVKPEARRVETSLLLMGIGSGMFAGRAVPFFGGTPDMLIAAALALSVLACFHAHVFRRAHPGYYSNAHNWSLRDLARDAPSFGLLGISLCLGLMIGFLVFERSKIVHALAGVAAYLAVSRPLFTRLPPARAVRHAFFVAAVSLLLDAVTHDSLLLSSFTFPFLCCVVFAALRIRAYAPRTVMSPAEQVSLQGLGIYAGISLHGFSRYPGLTFAETSSSVILVLLVTAYLLSFLPERHGADESTE